VIACHVPFSAQASLMEICNYLSGNCAATRMPICS